MYLMPGTHSSTQAKRDERPVPWVLLENVRDEESPAYLLPHFGSLGKLLIDSASDPFCMWPMCRSHPESLPPPSVHLLPTFLPLSPSTPVHRWRPSSTAATASPPPSSRSLTASRRSGTTAGRTGWSARQVRGADREQRTDECVEVKESSV